MIALSVSEYCVLEWSPARRGPSVAGRQGDARMSAAKFTKRDLKKRKKRKRYQKKKKKERRKREEEERKWKKRKKGKYITCVCMRVCVCVSECATDNYGSLPMFRSDFIAGPSPSTITSHATQLRFTDPNFDTEYYAAIDTILIKRSIFIALIDRSAHIDHPDQRSLHRSGGI